MPSALKVALITTTQKGMYSSMSVYAEMVQRSVAQISGDDSGNDSSNDIDFIRINLLEGFPDLSWFPYWLLYRLQLLWLMTQSNRCLAHVSADVYHLVDGSFAHALRKFNRPNVVVTVHDLIPVLQSEGKFDIAPPGRLATWLIKQNLQALNQYQYFCTVSQATQYDLKRYVGDSKNITTILSALRKSILDYLPEETTPWIERVENSTRTILHIGNAGFYKNRKAVLEVFSRLTSDDSIQLVIAGAAPDETLIHQMEALNINPQQVRFVTNPSDKALAKLYEQASILLFPSYYEGFGWPPLEAMMFGCPVVCSNAGSLPEVVGAAALTAPPDDYEQLANHCKTLLNKPSYTEHVIELGYQNAQRFSANKMAKSLISLYRQVANA